jgi:beta-galactosidase
VAYRAGRKIGEALVRTADEPAALRLTPDRSRLLAGDDLCYVLVEAVDGDGNLCPRAMNEVKFSVTGPALIAGVGNGDHHFPAEFTTDHVALFYGKAIVILRGADDAGAIRLEAAGDGLRAARVTVESLRAGAE